MTQHTLKSAIEDKIDLDVLKTILSSDVVFHTPFLSLPVNGLDKVAVLLEHINKNTETFEFVSEHLSGNEYCLFWKYGFDNQILNTVAIVKNDDQGLINELSMFMGPFPTLDRFVAKLNLGEVIVEQYWSPNKDWSKVSSNVFKLSQLNTAEDISFSMPFLLNPVSGKNKVGSLLQLMETVMTCSYESTIVENCGLVIDQFAAQVDDFTLTGVSLIKCDDNGDITDIVIYLSPWPMMKVLRNKCQSIAHGNAKYSFLSDNYWTSPVTLKVVD